MTVCLGLVGREAGKESLKFCRALYNGWFPEYPVKEDDSLSDACSHSSALWKWITK